MELPKQLYIPKINKSGQELYFHFDFDNLKVITLFQFKEQWRNYFTSFESKGEIMFFLNQYVIKDTDTKIIVDNNEYSKKTFYSIHKIAISTNRYEILSIVIQ
jgi:hypothetical protein